VSQAPQAIEQRVPVSTHLAYETLWEQTNPSLVRKASLIIFSSFQCAKHFWWSKVQSVLPSCMTTFQLVGAKVRLVVTTLQRCGTRSSFCMMVLLLVEAQVPSLVATLQLSGTRRIQSCMTTFHLVGAKVRLVVMFLQRCSTRSSFCMTALLLVEAQVPSLVATLQLRSTRRSKSCMTTFHLVGAKVRFVVTTLRFTVGPVPVQNWNFTKTVLSVNQ
jgi:hypothetical protein